MPVPAVAMPPMTLLYAPADRPERFHKALESGADAVIFDLEDAVSPNKKAQARVNLAEFFAASPGPWGNEVRVQVRINASGSPWIAEDIALLNRLPIEIGARIPKAERCADIAAIAQQLPLRHLFLLLESAMGIEKAFDLATCSSQVKGISLGEADLRSQLGITGDQGLAYARSRIVYAAAAGNLDPPSMAVYASVNDVEGLTRSCLEGKELGMFGRTAIHPRQLEAIRAVFEPTDQEVAKAQEIVAAMASARRADQGTVVLADGTFLDVAMVASAQRIVAMKVLPKM